MLGVTHVPRRENLLALSGPYPARSSVRPQCWIEPGIGSRLLGPVRRWVPMSLLAVLEKSRACSGSSPRVHKSCHGPGFVRAGYGEGRYLPRRGDRPHPRLPTAHGGEGLQPREAPGELRARAPGQGSRVSSRRIPSSLGCCLVVQWVLWRTARLCGALGCVVSRGWRRESWAGAVGGGEDGKCPGGFRWPATDGGAMPSGCTALVFLRYHLSAARLRDPFLFPLLPFPHLGASWCLLVPLGVGIGWKSSTENGMRTGSGTS